MDFTWTPEQIALREQAREVAADAVARFGRHNDSWINGYSKEFAKEMAALGWIGMTWPVEHGGGGRPPIDRLIVGEELIAAGAPIAAMWFADRQMGPTLIAYGRPDQQAEFLPGILSGETTWCIGMTEPDAGSDLAALKTSAVRDGDDWVINGQKIWTSFGEVADYCYLICRTSTDGPPHAGHQRDHRADGHARHRGPPDHGHDHQPPLLRGLLHRRARAGRTTSSASRARPSSRRCGNSSTSAAASTGWCRTTPCTRWRVERADTSDPLVRQEIAALEIGYRIGRILVDPRGARPGADGLLGGDEVLLHRARVARRRVRRPRARRRGDAVGPTSRRACCYAPGYTIMGGTSNVMRNILGERVLGLPREPR